MKRILIVATLVVLCIAAVGYRPVHEAWTRRQCRDEAVKNEIPLVLDAKTQAIFSGADRVETFRLVDFHEEEGYTKAEYTEMAASHFWYGDHQVLHAGPPQGKAFALALQRALSQASGAEDGAQCFDPGVGFRVWKAKAHVDICVCFYCSGIQITSPYIAPERLRQNPYNLPTMLGEARPALLVLSKQAFPQDAALARLN